MKLLTTVTLLVLVASSQAVAADSGQRLYASCAGCHGTAGADSGGVLPILAGQPKDALATSLRAFKAGTRPATIMQQIAKGFSEEQIAELAAYLAAQPAKQAK
jgi:sulfide dehydrogenase cytochrome subunit